MESMGINYWAVLVAGVAYMVLGAIWYTPALFGNAWLKAIGKTKVSAWLNTRAMFMPLRTAPTLTLPVARARPSLA